MSIYDEIRAAGQTQQPSMLDMFLKVNQIKHMQTLSALQQAETQQHQISADDAATIRQLAGKYSTPAQPAMAAADVPQYGGAGGPNPEMDQPAANPTPASAATPGSFDQQGFLNELTGKNPVAAAAYSKASAEAGEANLKMSASQLALSKAVLTHVSQGYAGLLGQPGGATYNDAMQMMTNLGSHLGLPQQTVQQYQSEIPRPADPNNPTPAENNAVHTFLLKHAFTQMKAVDQINAALGTPETKPVDGQERVFNVDKINHTVTPYAGGATPDAQGVLGKVPMSGPGKLETDIANTGVPPAPGTPVIPPGQAQAYRTKAQTVPSLVLNADNTGGLTPAALDNATDAYIKTGKMPDIGFGGVPIKRAILNYAPERAAQQGLILDPGVARTTYAANGASLAAVTKNADMINSFVKTASANMDGLLGLTKKIADTGIPWANIKIRNLENSVLGDADISAVKAQLAVLRPEFAKINQGTMNGVLSNSARDEMKEVLGDGETLGQYAAAAKVLKTDAANRVKFFNETKQDIVNKLKTGLGPVTPAAGTTPPPTATSGVLPATKINPANQKTYYLHSDNNYYPTPAVK